MKAACFGLGVVLTIVLGCRTTTAGTLEIAVHAGGTVPFYRQSFRYDPGPVAVPLPGISVEQRGSFGLEARGAMAFGASLAFQLNDVFGLEARIDTADVHVDALAARYEVRADLPAPLPDLSTQVDLGTGTVDLERLRPLSLNLRVRTPGRFRLMASGGVSYLPALRVVATETIGLGATGLDGRRSSVDVATLGLRARALPAEDRGRLGANGGLAVHLRVSPRAAVFAEGRGFVFGRHTVRWERADTRPLSGLEAALLREVESRLEPLDFNPAFFQLVGGLALSF